MSGPGVWAGLAESAFLADIDLPGRDLMPRIAKLVRGFAVGFGIGMVAATACLVLVLVPYTLATGRGGEGIAGLFAVALTLRDSPAGGLGITIERLVYATLTNGAFFVAFVAAATVFTGRQLPACVTVAGKVRWRLLAAGLALSTLVLGPLIAGSRLLSAEATAVPLLAISPHGAGRIAYALSTLLLIPSAAAEELIFRGWLVRQTAAFSRRPAILVGASAVIFSALHLDASWDGFITRALMGAGFAYMTLRLGGIEFSTGAHATNNILIVLFIQPLTPQSPGAASDVSAGSLLADAALIGGYVLITEAVVRVAPLRRWAGVRLEELTRPVPKVLPAR
ncbi:MAG: CPBP family intramembrane metalloprotease [Caulobacteraceae bacterium]|nr:CPBP family intramembrane metalloprotease [Caulobacteraceae bacterium]